VTVTLPDGSYTVRAVLVAGPVTLGEATGGTLKVGSDELFPFANTVLPAVLPGPPAPARTRRPSAP